MFPHSGQRTVTAANLQDTMDWLDANHQREVATAWTKAMEQDWLYFPWEQPAVDRDSLDLGMSDAEAAWLADQWHTKLDAKLRKVALANLPAPARTVRRRMVATRLAAAVLRNTPQSALADLDYFLDSTLEKGEGLPELLQWLFGQGWDCPQDSDSAATYAHLDSIGNAEVEALVWDALPGWNAAYDLLDRALWLIERAEAEGTTPTADQVPDSDQDQAADLASVRALDTEDRPPGLHLLTPTRAAHGPPVQDSAQVKTGLGLLRRTLTAAA